MGILTPHEYYHVYNRAGGGRRVFREASDYRRFVALLHVGNRSGRFLYRNLRAKDVFSLPRRNPLVDVIAYCLLPRHFHLVLRERRRRGVQRFMQKVCTAYGMYYNRKYRARGGLFAGPYRRTELRSEGRLRQAVQYVHLNPSHGDAEFTARKVSGDDLTRAVEAASAYEHSSMRDYLGEPRPERAVLSSGY